MIGKLRRNSANKEDGTMRMMFAAIAVASGLAGGPAAAWAELAAVDTAASNVPGVGSLFADLAALGYDLGKFRPDYEGRFPYR